MLSVQYLQISLNSLHCMAYRDQSALTLLLDCPCFYFVCLYVYVCSHPGTCVYMETRQLRLSFFLWLSLAWPGIIPVLGGDWLAWLAREPQGSSCNQPQCCAYTCVRLDVTSMRILGVELGSTCLCGKHFTDWAVSPPLFCSLHWVLGMLHQILFQAPEAGFREGMASLFCGLRLVLWKHYVITPFCRHSINTAWWIK